MDGTTRLTIDITETRRLAFLGVVQPACPVDGHIAFPAIQSRSTFHTAASTDAAELEQAIEDWTVISNVVFALLFGEVVHVVRRDALQEINIFVCVELRHLVLGSGFGAVDLQLLVQPVVHDQTVSHANPMGFHGMAGVVCIVADIAVVEVRDLLRLGG